MKFKRLSKPLGATAAVTLLGFVGFQWVFSVPDKPQLISIDDNQQHIDWNCYQAEQTSSSENQSSPIDKQGELNVLVWNIHKQGDQGWQQALQEYSSQSNLMLLQEASLTPELNQWIGEQAWGASYVNAFKAFGVSAGVLNLSDALPIKACAYTALEPWILLPKSALFAQYALSNGQQLGVINLHSINFTFGTKEFQLQINHLSQAVKSHIGPLIIAGDFNTWSETRTKEVRAKMAQLGMHEVHFSVDNRRRFINGLVFDHVFYRDLELNSAMSPKTTASDHNPMLVKFTLQNQH
ncbi:MULTISPECIES: endonuclease/exonuclease/phosphatase family protein [Vibrio]|uniref:Endonuclease/exonuclease/phosphatase family protein n=1 Tax=Vibrio algicola TaxID=2662262 RepID=A0A5Q0TBG3_9VIBR|nr:MULTISPECIES: endonuclease/exonuclease/phosphatase family protein [Vibrio]MBD1575064.1 endonuclease/exonuclease/phosphatase family protein [Vibrio sp. S11_S32]